MKNGDPITITIPPVRQSWVCGRCDASNAPHVDQCACSVMGPPTTVANDLICPGGVDFVWPLEDKPNIVLTPKHEFTLDT